jgi:hypothetical protein
MLSKFTKHMFIHYTIFIEGNFYCRSQWPCGLRRGSAAARLLGLWVRIAPGARMSVCCECCVLSRRGLCDGLVTPPEESYQTWLCVKCVITKPRKMRRPMPPRGCRAIGKTKSATQIYVTCTSFRNVIVVLLSPNLLSLQSKVCIVDIGGRDCDLTCAFLSSNLAR